MAPAVSLADSIACSYYASPAGGGDGSSPSSPFLISAFWAVAKPGMTLCLLDGHYSGGDSMISPPPNLSGVRGVPIVVKALNDGQALVTGDSVRPPVLLNFNSWFLVEGINACCSSASVVEISNSSNSAIRRVAGWDAHDGNDKIFGVHYSTNSLLEDVAGWGTARKIFESSYSGDFTTIRRGWGRWERSTVVGPKMVYSLSYNNYNMLVENSLGTWSGQGMPATYTLLDYSGLPYTGSGGGLYTNGQVQQPYGIFSADGLNDDTQLTNARLLGSLAYTAPGDALSAQSLVFFTKIDGVEIRDTTAFYNPLTSGGKYTFELHGLADGGDPKADAAINITSFGRFGALISEGWQTSNGLLAVDPGTAYGYGETIFDTSHGANLCYAYEDGTLTNRPLWPWPMNDRIHNALAESGRMPLDIGGTVQLMFGRIPAACVAPPSVPQPSVLLPVAGRVRGWTTDLQITNLGDRAAEAQLILIPTGNPTPISRALFLRSHQSVTLTDAIQSVFGMSESFGAVQLLTATEATRAFDLRARIYIATPNGTLGTGITRAGALASAGVSQFVTGIANTAGFRSTLGAANPSQSPQTFQIILRDETGTVQGMTNTIVLQPETQVQWNLPDLFPQVPGLSTAEFQPAATSAAPLAYATLVDNLSTDPTYYSSSVPGDVTYVAPVAKTTGANSSNWQTDLTIMNPSDASISFTASFLEHDHDNSTSVQYKSFSLGPHQTIQVSDALGRWFKTSNTFGGLRISTKSSAGVVISGRTYTASTSGSGTVGQQVGISQPDDLSPTGNLTGLREDDSFRSSLGFVNPGTATAAVLLNLLDQDGVSQASTTLAIPPFSYAQDSISGLFPSVSFSPGKTYTVTFDAGSAKIAGFASIVDNSSEDPTFLSATP
jgi:hypothetical protein